MNKEEVIGTFGILKGNAIWEFYRRYDLHTIDDKMNAFNGILEGFGVEPIFGEYTFVDSYYREIIALYVNMGDTYDKTIVYDTMNKEFIVCSWGDFYESHPDYMEHLKQQSQE